MDKDKDKNIKYNLDRYLGTNKCKYILYKFLKENKIEKIFFTFSEHKH